jgi:ABC-type Zn uptake system ZnuABC Zn-binding protein ZnuA
MRFIGWTLAALWMVLALGGAVPAQAGQRIRVITTSTDLKALAEEVGGERVEAESLSRGYQNPHSIEVRPSYMVKLAKANLFVRIGLDHEPYVEQLLAGARNPRIMPGSPGYVEAWRGIELLEVPPPGADRSLGDIHVFGNTHVWLDPENAKIIARNIAEGLKRVSPGDTALFDRNLQQFSQHIDAALSGWTRKLAPFRGTRIVTYHSDLAYFARRFGLLVVGYVEPRPGVPPSPSHVAELTGLMRAEKVPLLVVVNYYDPRLPERIGGETGAKVLITPLSVGGAKGIDTYFALMDYLVTEVAAALTGASPPKS